MDEKDYEILREEEFETTKEVKTLKDLSVEAIENMENIYQSEFDEGREEAEAMFEEKIETLEEEKEEVEEKKENVEKKENPLKKLKEKWQNLSQKNKILNIIVAVLILILIGVGIYFLIPKNQETDIPKEPDVVLEMGSYRYENGKLIFLENEKELGSYECENKKENLCKIAKMTRDNTMDAPKKVEEDGEELSLTSKIYFDRFVFLTDNSEESSSEIKLYDLKEEKVLKTVFEVIPDDSFDSYVILKDKEGHFGLEEIKEDSVDVVIPYNYDQMNIIPYQQELKLLSVRKDNNYYLANLENKIITKAVTNEVVGATEKYMKAKDKSGYYHVYDYNAKELLTTNENWEYIELLDEVMFLVERNTLYIKDYEENLMTNNTIGLQNKNYNPVETYVKNKLTKTERAWSYEKTEQGLQLTLYEGENEEIRNINLLEGKLSNKLPYISYFDGRLYIFSDPEKKNPLGSYECTNRNQIEKDTTTLTNCKPAMDSVLRETRNAKENKDYGGGVIPVFGKQYMFIQDGDTILLQDFGGGSTLAKYESVDTSSYTGANDITFATTNNVLFIAKSASSKKYGVANITDAGVKPIIPFEKDSIKILGDYYVVEENGSFSLYDFDGKKVTNDMPSPIVDYHKNYVTTLKDNQYFVHGFKEDISNDGYTYIELYDEYYGAVKNGRVHLYRYDDKEKYEYIYEEDKEAGIELETSQYYDNRFYNSNTDYKVLAFKITIGNDIKVEIGSTNGTYKNMGVFSKNKLNTPIDEDDKDDE